MNERATRILAITGANGSGKTTIALNIAKELENNDKEVCIVNFDTIHPLSTLKKNYENYNVSLGYILTKETTTTQKDIYTSMIPLTDKISIISYIYGDIEDKYPKLLSNRIKDFINLLIGTVDYIILDCSANIIRIENRTSMQVADKILNVIDPTYKNIAYTMTYNLLLDRIDMSTDKIIYLANKIMYDVDYKANIQKMNIKYYYELPYLEEIKKNENNPLLGLKARIHNTELYKRNFKKVMRQLYKIEYDQSEISEESKIEIKNNIIIDNKSNEKEEEITKKIEELKGNNKNKNDNKQNNRKSILDNIFGKKQQPKKAKPITTKYVDKEDEY